jgi:hypothetical protein
MKTAIIILAILLVLFMLFGVSVLMAILLRIQELDDKITEFEEKLN